MLVIPCLVLSGETASSPDGRRDFSTHDISFCTSQSICKTTRRPRRRSDRRCTSVYYFVQCMLGKIGRYPHHARTHQPALRPQPGFIPPRPHYREACFQSKAYAHALARVILSLLSTRHSPQSRAQVCSSPLAASTPRSLATAPQYHRPRTVGNHPGPDPPIPGAGFAYFYSAYPRPRIPESHTATL